MKKTFLLALPLLGLLLSGCNDAEDLYAHSAARFNYNLVATTPPLLNALTGSGQFCTITYSPSSTTSYTCTFKGMAGGSYTSAPQSTTINGNPMSLSGFIVGTPSLINMSGQQNCVAFDGACPNCYKNDLVQYALRFSDQVGHVQCHRCHRIYDLNNEGIVSSSEGGRKLLRYHITTSPTSISIYN